MTTATDPFPRVPFPAGAVKVEWQDLCSPNAFRYFEGSRWVVDRREDLRSSRDIDVYIAGIQELDGTVKREAPRRDRQADRLAHHTYRLGPSSVWVGGGPNIGRGRRRAGPRFEGALSHGPSTQYGDLVPKLWKRCLYP
ncbi:MAG: hypothetical protein WBZ37_20275 [Mycobacterium sp.]